MVSNLSEGSLTLHPLRVFHRDLVDIRSGKTVRLSQDSRQVLLILLSGTECPLCLDESSTWERLAERLPDKLRVIGVFVGTTGQDIQAYVRTQKSGFELYSLPDGDEFARTYEKPLKVMLDRWGRVRFAWGPSNSQVGHDALQREILSALGV